MKSIFVALAAMLTLSMAMAQAEEAASPLSSNLSLTSDYRYRGLSQSRLDPALQGGADYAFANGFYLGSWASTIKWIKDAPYNGGANVEIDAYGGYKTELATGLTLDAGALTYIYPSNDLSPKADTTEIYGALNFGPVTAKYSHSVTNLFGTADSKGSGYLDVSASFDVGGGFTVVPHVGYQKVKNNSVGSYTDYSLTLNKDYARFSLGAGYVGTNTDAYMGGSAMKNLGKDGLVVSVKKPF